MMFALLRKEWRLNRAVVIGCLVTAVMPYAISVGNVWINPGRYSNVEPRSYLEAVELAAWACLVITVIFAAAFGGLTFAGERRERTAEFMAMLPVSRGAIIVSKLVVPLACLIGLLGVHLLVLTLCGVWADRIGIDGRDNLLLGMILVKGYAAAFFAIAWSLSVFLRSAAIAAAIAIGVGVGLFFGLLEWGERVNGFLLERNYVRSNDETVAIAVICATAVLIAGVVIIISSLHYRRRVEP
jgi:ABC-type transport system involved in multi-copper enzyme maturation permease subunit